jgi:methylmalonyl-CoA mutase cobalamin-binding domain/chain
MNKIGEEIKLKIKLKSASLAEKIVDLQYEKQPDLWEKYGVKGKVISLRDAEYHLPFLSEAIELENKLIFTNYIAWVKKLFAGIKIPDSGIIGTLHCMKEVFAKEFSKDEYEVLSEYIDVGLAQIDQPVDEIESYIDVNAPNGELAMKYNEALLNGNRFEASKIIMDAIKKGVPVKDIYIDIFQKSQYEVGRLWLENKITVAKEHFCSAATQQIMSQLYPYIFNTDRNGKRMVAANVGGELHEIGIRMVADFFELDGWDTYYLGANTPMQSILDAIIENKANVVGLSVAIPYHIGLLKETIQFIRSNTTNDLKILIGGYALKDIGDKWKEFGADGYAPDALNAVKYANQLIAS